jgi:hypothetical protein
MEFVMLALEFVIVTLVITRITLALALAPPLLVRITVMEMENVFVDNVFVTLNSLALIVHVNKVIAQVRTTVMDVVPAHVINVLVTLDSVEMIVLL